MFKKNYADEPMEDPVDIVFGERIDFSDLRQKLRDAGPSVQEEVWAAAGERVSAAILELAKAHPKLAQERRDKEEKQRARRYQGENLDDDEIASASV